MAEKNRRILGSERGMALLLAVTVMSLLVAVTLEFNRNMRQEITGSATTRENSQLGAIVRSGYNLAEAVLLQDLKDNTFDSIHDRWAKLGESDLSSLFGRGSLKVTVTDLGGKLQLNSLGATLPQVVQRTRDIFTRLLLSGDFGDLSVDDVRLIVDAVTDWVDADDNEIGIDETESSYYLSLQPSYSSKNGPLEHVEELLLVRGITRDLYFGTGEYKGLHDLITVHGDDGGININSAPVPILQALHADMSEELAQMIVDFRGEESNGALLASSDWYRNLPSWPGDVTFDTQVITVTSSFFAIAAQAKFAEMERSLEAVVHRPGDPDKFRMISRKVE